MSDIGYIYCLSNPSLKDNILKIGKVSKGDNNRTPEIRANEISNTTGVVLPYVVEFAIKVNDCEKLERQIHKIYKEKRINLKREFFSITKEEVYELFKSYVIMGAEFYKEEEENEPKEVKEDKQIIQRFYDTPIPGQNKGCRNINKCFTDQQRISFTTKNEDKEEQTIISIYDKNTQRIIYNNQRYKSLSSFAGDYLKIVRPDRSPSINGWFVCKCEINGQWVSTFKLPEL